MELGLIEQIKRIARTLPLATNEGSLIVSIGDDCAEFLPSPNKSLLLTTDTMAEDIHFRTSYSTPYLLGRKLASVNLSDIAAMAGRPLIALLNLEVPEYLANPKDQFWYLFAKGLVERLGEFGAILAGGDTVKSPANKLSLTLTLTGKATKGETIYRSGAKAGDMIYCSGFLGESACGLKILEKRRIHLPLPIKRHLIHKHLDPEPLIDLGKTLANCEVTSMIDVSDGVATDLAHIARESKVCAEIDKARIPLSRAVRIAASTLNLDPIELALYGGEDFQLLWTIPPEKAKNMERKIAPVLGHAPFFLGHIKEGKGVWLKSHSKLSDITFKGYEH